MSLEFELLSLPARLVSRSIDWGKWSANVEVKYTQFSRDISKLLIVSPKDHRVDLKLPRSDGVDVLRLRPFEIDFFAIANEAQGATVICYQGEWTLVNPSWIESIAIIERTLNKKFSGLYDEIFRAEKVFDYGRATNFLVFEGGSRLIDLNEIYTKTNVMSQKKVNEGVTESRRDQESIWSGFCVNVYRGDTVFETYDTSASIPAFEWCSSPRWREERADQIMKICQSGKVWLSLNDVDLSFALARTLVIRHSLSASKLRIPCIRFGIHGDRDQAMFMQAASRGDVFVSMSSKSSLTLVVKNG